MERLVPPPSLSRVEKLCYGEVSEWFKVPLSKSGRVNSPRGFDSHPLRQITKFEPIFMNKEIDPYFEHRLQAGQTHRVLRSIEVRASEFETESNKKALPLFLLDLYTKLYY